ncbi:CLUMA_CG016024, isoform A [Clunio marinus]|uniref:CLUMA_CG016024, isoform A n=1 Tax=Clunio marinus TaxID=568069 RepID=A0A1J1IT60_9DIPT|nr:CLUMA_CG016024, isoform A [Clunio marinus]
MEDARIMLKLRFASSFKAFHNMANTAMLLGNYGFKIFKMTKNSKISAITHSYYGFRLRKSCPRTDDYDIRSQKAEKNFYSRLTTSEKLT